MITQGVITAALIGIVITGLVPIIGGIVLMATGKIKASSFWAGVLAYIIALIAASIVAIIIGFAAAASTENPAALTSEGNTAAISIVSAIATGVLFSLAMGICIKSCMKLRTFNAALSCGLGFGIGYAVTLAIQLVILYVTFGNINSGAFDVQYAQYVKMGAMDKETVNLIKETYTGYTVITIVQQILTAVFFAAALAAAAVFVMRFVCSGKASLGILSAMATLTLYSIGSAIPNVVAAIIVSAAIGTAALIFAFRMKEQVVPPEKKAVSDPFLNSIADAQKDE